MLAAIRGHITTVSALIAAGANVNAANRDGNTALTLATHEGHDETAFRLLNAMPPQEISPLINSFVNLLSLELKLLITKLYLNFARS
jgi:ankyrin repeat protein